ncbi:TPR repeat-containing protein [Bifidobacterium actinocoloniiforme DSM 22766]|uniref:TPR repeat-containing protein n=1 Tax=Bifidobacterium actinocoloniiforme DSM 22766 TaxID=1437605 RepID=A0A086YZJ8_9BIFI|nr:DUF5107 domain-containing protein [Bifidobacterium actinocoloniiforme]AKV55019.1 tetratricopeptide repeat containing protein [Bifidobacterium actinocoloniiforme DSM 22766]KFI39698.1 TPR repeat-containing protein [Bifidobacterium actinocoloniiforme DSM 22766]
MKPVSATNVQLTIPTYEVGKPDSNPQFIEGRVYQGSTGKVYPYPVIESITDDKKDKVYNAVNLENEFLKVTVLPELGGRIQYATDKTNNYDFVYRNDVVKPALVGLLGPWISGGIEFNWPQHHRPTTFMPVDYRLVELDHDGRGVQCHDVDRIHGTEVVTTIALYPGKSYIEISADLYNGTPLPQSFLWWANPAVPVNEHTKTVMPPDVVAVMDHGKRDVSRYPIATGTYYKHDYSQGVDISRYKNIPVPTSYMAAHSDFDFVGGYDFKEEAGILHVADHHISPGKKQWTWGSGDFGHAWDRNLTDANGPYVELMTGVFTDNQPDFTWLKPYETKHFTQYFMPYRSLGLVKNATLDAAVNLEFGPADPIEAERESEGVDGAGLQDGQGRFKVSATSRHAEVIVKVVGDDNQVLAETRAEIGPDHTCEGLFNTQGKKPWEISISVTDEQGRSLVAYRPLRPKIPTIPSPAKAPSEPSAMATNEELLLTGQHLEQYRHATSRPDPYYLEGLKRDPNDTRINVAYGELLLRRGAFEEARQHFKTSIKRLTEHNPNPYDGRAFTDLGLAEFFLGNDQEAYDAWYKATWDETQASQGYYYLAMMCARTAEWAQGLAFVNRSLEYNALSSKALALKSFLLRRQGREQDALESLDENLKHNAFDFVSGFERHLLGDSDEVFSLMGNRTYNYLNLARTYMSFGAYEEACAALLRSDEQDALVNYYLAYCEHRLGRLEQSARHIQTAEKLRGLYCFPNALEDIFVLRDAIGMGANPRAAYYLGCLYYDKLQTSRAVSMWERSCAADPSFPTVHRNLALAYYNKLGRKHDALEQMEEAFRLDESDARVFLELDQLHQAMGWTYLQRRELFENHMTLVESRDDLYVEYMEILNLTGSYEQAFKLMSKRHFHPWEGGEGKVTAQYRLSLILIALQAMKAKDWQLAQEKLIMAQRYPENLGEGKLEGQKDNDIHYFLGLVNQQLNKDEEATAEFRKASTGPNEVKGALYYNDQPSEMILFQGLAHLALGEAGQANARFYRLLDYGEQHLNESDHVDFFAVSLPDFRVFERDYGLMNHVHCQYLIALANLGMGNEKESVYWFGRVLADDPTHMQATAFMKAITVDRLAAQFRSKEAK